LLPLLRRGGGGTPLAAHALALLRPHAVFLALDAATLRQQQTVLGIRLVCHQTAAPIAWRVIPTQQRSSWRPAWEALLQAMRTVIPRPVPVYALADWGLWAQWLFRAIQ